jgi:endonuclease/exonuclease/phosphatase family metal-dependent hydrolase
MIIDDLRPEAETPWVLLGDFNDWNKKVAKKIEKELGVHEAFKFLHGKYPPTFPSFMPVLSLDRVFVNKLIPIEAQTLKDTHWKKLSDHLPLYVEIDIGD